MKSVTENQGKFPPMPEKAWRFTLLSLYMQRYARDPVFHKRFEGFYRRHQEFVKETMKDTYGDYLGDEPSDRETAFYRDRTQFMESTGLNALPDDFALQQVDQWLNVRARRGLDLTTDLFGTEIVLPKDFGFRNPGVERDEWLIPVLRVARGDARWCPGELATDVIARLMHEFEAEVRREVGRIEVARRAVGYEEQDSRPALERHMNWLYRRVAYRKRCEDIATDEQLAGTKIGGEGIQKATKQIAVTIGVAIPRPRRTRHHQSP